MLWRVSSRHLPKYQWASGGRAETSKSPKIKISKKNNFKHQLKKITTPPTFFVDNMYSQSSTSIDPELCRKGVQILRVIFSPDASSSSGGGSSPARGQPSSTTGSWTPASPRLSPAIRDSIRAAFEDVAGDAATIDRQLTRVAVRILTRTSANRRGIPLREDELDAMMERASSLISGGRQLTLSEFEVAVAPYL